MKQNILPTVKFNVSNPSVLKVEVYQEQVNISTSGNPLFDLYLLVEFDDGSDEVFPLLPISSFDLDGTDVPETVAPFSCINPYPGIWAFMLFEN